MKISEFNNQPLHEKKRYIKSFVYSTPFITGALIFEEYWLSVLYSMGGELIECTAHAHDDNVRKDVLRLLKGRDVVALDCSNLPDIAKAINNKLLKARGRLN